MAVGKETGGGVTLQQLRQELKPITERLDGIDKRLDKLESGQEKLRDDLIGAFNEALARAATQHQAVQEGGGRWRGPVTRRSWPT